MGCTFFGPSLLLTLNQDSRPHASHDPILHSVFFFEFIKNQLRLYTWSEKIFSGYQNPHIFTECSSFKENPYVSVWIGDQNVTFEEGTKNLNKMKTVLNDWISAPCFTYYTIPLLTSTTFKLLYNIYILLKKKNKYVRSHKYVYH